jgi:AcrR family transcriptional regulator
MLVTPTIAANLLVPASIEALLSRSSKRSDLTARLQRLHAAALMECAINGYADLKLADVAARAKVSTASIYKTYKDRDALLVAAVETLFHILASDVIEIPQVADPVKRVEQLLIAHGEVYAQPLSTWLFRLYASLASSGHVALCQTAMKIFQGIDFFWHNFIRQLVAEGHLADLVPEQIVPQLLGPIERATILYQLGCGDEDAGRAQALADAARHGAQTLFRLWGRALHDQGQASASHARGVRIGDVPVQAPTLPPIAVRLADKLKTSERYGPLEETDARILLAAAVVCQERGYHAAGMQEVADRAKVSTATLYKRFLDKGDLFSAAVEREFALRVGVDDIAMGLQDPATGLANALTLIAQRAKDPEWTWMYNGMMASDISGTPRMIALARQNRAVDEALIRPILAASVPPHPSNRGLSDAEMALSTNWLLGTVERFGLFTLILFGSDRVDTAEIATFATNAAVQQIQLMVPDLAGV